MLALTDLHTIAWYWAKMLLVSSDKTTLYLCARVNEEKWMLDMLVAYPFV